MDSSGGSAATRLETAQRLLSKTWKILPLNRTASAKTKVTVTDFPALESVTPHKSRARRSGREDGFVGSRKLLSSTQERGGRGGSAHPPTAEGQLIHRGGVGRGGGYRSGGMSIHIFSPLPCLTSLVGMSRLCPHVKTSAPEFDYPRAPHSKGSGRSLTPSRSSSPRGSGAHLQGAGEGVCGMRQSPRGGLALQGGGVYG